MHIHNICFYGEVSIFFTFYHFDSGPRFPPFLLHVRWKSGVTFVRRCFRDELMKSLFEPRHETICLELKLLEVYLREPATNH